MTSFLERVLGKEEVKPVTTEVPERVTGKIIKLSPGGWGFLSTKEIKFTRIFFHWTALEQNTLNFTELKMGMNLSFKPIKLVDKGWRAIQIHVVDEKTEE